MFSYSFYSQTATSSSEHEGKIATSKDGLICMNVQKYGVYYWEPLSSLSGGIWKKYRTNVGSKIIEFKNSDNAKWTGIIKKMNAQIKECKETSHALYEHLTPELKREFIKKNKNSWLAKETCSVCLEKTTNKNKNKCVHNDCCGMCDNCFKSHTDEEGKCIACKKNQTIQCPICFDEFTKEKMCKSETCTHYVCWECYGRSFHHERPITNCPACRAQFTKSKNVYFADDDDDDYIDYDSEYDSDIADLHTEFEDDDLMSTEIFDRIENLDATRTDEILSIVQSLINNSPSQPENVLIGENSISI